MIRAATVHARLLLSRSYVSQAKAASRWPLVSRKPSLLGCGRPFYQMDTRGQDENKVSTSRGCHTSPESQELAKKSCVPCNSKDLHPMSEDSAKKLLEQVNGWELTTEGGILKLHRAWKVKNFAKGLEFFQLVAAIAEEEATATVLSVECTWYTNCISYDCYLKNIMDKRARNPAPAKPGELF